jgi:hypothetical protein
MPFVRFLALIMLMMLSAAARAQEEKKPAELVVGKDGLRLDGKVAKEDKQREYRFDVDGVPQRFKGRGQSHAVKLEADHRYTISADVARGEGNLDPVLIVHDPTGQAVAFDDDSGGGLNARLEFQPRRTAVFDIHVAGLEDTVGAYKLTIVSSIVNTVHIGFPARAFDPADLSKSDTAWQIDWEITNPNNGLDKKATKPASVLVIRSARFMFRDRYKKPRWWTVVKNLAVGEILVAYDKMDPVYLDVHENEFRLIPARSEYLGPACVLPGAILDSRDERMSGRVLKEVHDDGLRWMNGANHARRGEKMLLWALLDADNYRYLLEYGFSDDGVISCRLGATAHSLFNRQKDQRDIHLHVGCWRFDPELQEDAHTPKGGARHNQVLLVRRLPRTQAVNGIFKLDVSAFNPDETGQASEGYADWKPEEFTTLRVQSKVRKNSSKDPHFTALDLIPQRHGAVRNYPWKYAFANHDFWVTRRSPTQPHFHEVPLYAQRSRPLDGTPVTIWHNAASWHVPRGEDYGNDGVTAKDGAALTTWTGFALRPVNLFDSTPLYRDEKTTTTTTPPR